MPLQRTEFSAKYFPGQILDNPVRVSYSPSNINISYRLPNPKAYLLASVGGLSAIHRSGLKSSGSSYSLPFLSIALYEANQFRNFSVIRCITKYSDRRPSPLVHGTRRRRRLLSPCAEYLKQDVNVPTVPENVHYWHVLNGVTACHLQKINQYLYSSFSISTIPQGFVHDCVHER